MKRQVSLFFKNSSYSILKEKKLLQTIHKGNESFIPDLLNAHDEHEKAKEKLQKLLIQNSIPYIIINDFDTDKEDNDDSLVITLGGDGTFIHASHFVQRSPILGINSAPQSSTGHFCSISIDKPTYEIMNYLENILNDQIKPQKLGRLMTRKNGKDSGFPFINDALFSNDNPADTSRYLIEMEKTKQKQKSSGIWISTSSGSTAAFDSAGGKYFSEINEKTGMRQYGFIVRELYQRKKDSLQYGIIQEDESFSITSRMFHGKIYLDGRRNCIPMNFGDHIEFSFYKKPLLKY